MRRRGEVTVEVWQRMNTALGLIRAGYTTKGELAEILGLPLTTTYYVIQQMRRVGWVKCTRGTVGTLHLTEKGQQMAPYLALATLRPDGALERIPQRRASNGQ